jgi:HAD superfamily hydrolase (TIGR01509 family)
VAEFRAVLFDFHTTLVDGGDPYQWLTEAATATGAPLPTHVDAAAHFLSNVWEHAGDVDPASTRDLSPLDHRRVFDELMDHARAAEDVDIDPVLAAELYRIMPEQWHPYADAVPVLHRLREAGIHVALISNVGIEVDHILRRTGLADYLDAVVLSCHVGAVKPDPVIFEQALDALGVDARHALMVGDSQVADAGAVAVGVRTLLLPRTSGRVRGLDIVCRVVGVPYEPAVGLGG